VTMIVIDASVWVAYLLPQDTWHAASVQFLDPVLDAGTVMVVPTLFLVSDMSTSPLLRSSGSHSFHGTGSILSRSAGASRSPPRRPRRGLDARTRSIARCLYPCETGGVSDQSPPRLVTPDCLAAATYFPM
jgi:hypothetical protein